MKTHGRKTADFIGKIRVRKKVLFVKEKYLTIGYTHGKVFKVIVK